MSLSIELNCEDPTEFEEEVDGVIDNWSSHREAMMVAAGEKIVGNLKREAPTNTGRLGDTIRQVGTGTERRILAGGKQGVDYTLPLIEGSKPHPPGSSDPSENRALSRWARRNNYPGGFESIYWSIFWYGTEPNDFVTPALSDAEEEAQGVMTQVLRNRGVLD